ncbi:hypothetical protein, partial [Neisseria meningitidis]
NTETLLQSSFHQLTMASLKMTKEEVKSVFLSYAGDAKVMNNEQLLKAFESLGASSKAKDALAHCDLNKNGVIDTPEEFEALADYAVSA